MTQVTAQMSISLDGYYTGLATVRRVSR